MANSSIETSFQNLVNVIKEKTYPAASGAAVEADIADIKIDITDLGISKIGMSQIGMANGVASLDSNGKIPASQLPNTGSDAYRYNIVTKSTGGYDASITINKYLNEELVSSTDYPYQTFDHTHVIIDSFFDMIYAEDGQAKYTMTLLENSTDHSAGYSKRWGYDETVDFSETFVMSDKDISFIAPPFYANVSYAVGDKVTRNDSFYRCKTPHTGAWDIADFDKISVDELFDEVYDSLDDIQIDIDQLGISKIGISQVGMANGVAGLNSEGKLDFDDIDADIVSKADLEDMWDGEDLPNLPSGYTMLSYIQNTDAQWINTGVSVTENTSADLIGLTPVEASRYGTFLGEGDQSGRIWSIRYKADSGVIQFQLGDDDKAINGPTLVNGSEYNVHAEIGKIVVNGTEYTGSGQSLGVPIATLRIFDNGSGERARAKLFRCKIYESGVLIRDFIAAKRGTDNAIGMYDVVNNTFYGNDGNGDFTAGSPVGTHTSIGDSSTFKNLIDIVKLNMLPISRVGLAGGVASLGNDGKVPSGQLPDFAQVAYSGSYNDLEDLPEYGKYTNFEACSWDGLSSLYGQNVWTDGENIYHSNGTTHHVLNQSTGIWESKTWNGLTNFSGSDLWTDGTDIYYSNQGTQLVLDKSTSTWSAKTWGTIQPGYPQRIWTDGTDVYYSNGNTQYVLDKANSNWLQKTWTGMTNFNGAYIWNYGTDIYYSYGNTQYVLDKANSSWTVKNWNGLTNFDGNLVWKDVSDGKYYYSYSPSSKYYVLDKDTSTWSAVAFSYPVNGDKMWSYGNDTYYSNGSGSGSQLKVVHSQRDFALLDVDGKLLPEQTNHVTIGQKSTAAIGNGATAEGYIVNAGGEYSHAEGRDTASTGENSHAEGFQSTASAKATHAEGYLTEATGLYAHAEGAGAVASHERSHAEGSNTKTGRTYQHVQGQWNVGKNTTAMEIGWGSSNNNRLNIFEVDTNGNLVVTGDITDGDGNTLADMLGMSKVGMANGVASLDSNGKVPISQIPGSVDEIKEGYLNSTDGKFYEESSYTTEIPAASDKIYVDLSTNLEYRWGGSAYVEISKSIALGRTASTAFPGDAGKAIEDCVPSGASASNKFATMDDIPSVPSVPSASDANPVMNGTASPGDSSDYSRANHVHPSDTSKLNASGGYVSGNIAPNTDGTIDFGFGDHRYHYGYFRRLCAVESICNSPVANTNRIDLPSKTGTLALTSDIPTITAQTTDPGAGSALTTGNLIVVYEA